MVFSCPISGKSWAKCGYGNHHSARKVPADFVHRDRYVTNNSQALHDWITKLFMIESPAFNKSCLTAFQNHVFFPTTWVKFQEVSEFQAIWYVFHGTISGICRISPGRFITTRASPRQGTRARCIPPHSAGMVTRRALPRSPPWNVGSSREVPTLWSWPGLVSSTWLIWKVTTL